MASAGVRIARATRQLARMREFYRDGLGFELVDGFEEHAGYTGIIMAMPGGAHLEITQHARGRIDSAPDPDDLLVLYLPSSSQVARLRKRLESLGHGCVRPANPYWLDKGVTFEDPDGWRVVLCGAGGI
jgi:catechol 2,3-dioxygenase-like lactoylglutathione lyase family enzyme